MIFEAIVIVIVIVMNKYKRLHHCVGVKDHFVITFLFVLKLSHFVIPVPLCNKIVSLCNERTYSTL